MACPVGTECQLEVDIVLKSSDGTLLGAHSKNLGLYSDGFPETSAIVLPNRDDAVELPEDAETLNLLLQFMHKRQLPDVKALSLDVLLKLAEAAEKYLVYSAMSTCVMVLEEESVIAKAPVNILCFSAKHNYPKIMDTAAAETILLSFSEFKKRSNGKATPTICYAWFRYREGRIEALEEALENPPEHLNVNRGVHNCVFWHDYHRSTVALCCYWQSRILRLHHPLDPNLFDTYKESKLGGCSECALKIQDWKKSIEVKRRDFPAFHTYV